MAGGEKELTPPGGIQVRIKTPAEIKIFGRGFYQVEEDCLYIPLFPAGTFYSFVDAEEKGATSKSSKNNRIRISLDIDREGRLLFIKVATPRRFWTRDDDMNPPTPIEWADLRVLTFRAQVNAAAIVYAAHKSCIHLRLDDKNIAHTYNIAENIIAGTSLDNYLVSLWISNIEDDRAAQLMAHWRKELRGDDANQSPAKKYTRIEVE
ncbi:MAG: hypothetical protein R3F48_07325 [Candidatus Zixiibacteriota bacterium]